MIKKIKESNFNKNIFIAILITITLLLINISIEVYYTNRHVEKIESTRTEYEVLIKEQDKKIKELERILNSDIK